MDDSRKQQKLSPRCYQLRSKNAPTSQNRWRLPTPFSRFPNFPLKDEKSRKIRKKRENRRAKGGKRWKRRNRIEAIFLRSPVCVDDATSVGPYRVYFRARCDRFARTKVSGVVGRVSREARGWFTVARWHDQGETRRKVGQKQKGAPRPEIAVAHTPLLLLFFVSERPKRCQYRSVPAQYRVTRSGPVSGRRW